jgi:hypothetical protein
MLLLALLSCTRDEPTDTADQGFQPETFCPGSEGCEDGSGDLSAGAASVVITPPCFESWVDLDGDAELDAGEETLDCGCDRLCPEDEGYPGPDEGEGDGEFQVIWMAGFQNNRPAAGVRDELWARAVVFEQGDVSMAIVVLDVVGWMQPEVQAIRAQLPGIDHVTVLSTHTHEGPDTMGLWGEEESRSGVNADYRSWVVDQAVESVRLAQADLRGVDSMVVGHVDASSYHEVGILTVLQDKRDPKVVDTQLSAARFVDAQGETIASLVHFGNHPEAMADENGLITSDYVHALREGVESGVEWGGETRPGVGGTCLFLTGTVGGMMTPLGVTVYTPDGQELREYTFERTDAIGKLKAGMALDALEAGELVATPSLAFATNRFTLPVENWGFQAMFLSGIIDRETVGWDPAQAIDEDNQPQVETELDHLRIGPLEMLTFPGEVLPELAIGGYDGSAVGTTYDELISEDNLNPPDLTLAPEGPYWKDLLPGEHRWLLGLANDELGYFVPPYDFELHPSNPWFDEPEEGDHYEETNSLGPSTAPLLDERARELMDWVDVNQR